MPNVLAMSFEGALAPAFDLACLEPGGRLPDGWGLGYYHGAEPSASVLKEPNPQQGSIRSQLVRAWDHLASPLFLLHLRTATWGNLTDANTQPFKRSFGRRDWLFAHSGSLESRLEPTGPQRFEPVGSTDTEVLFCELLGRIAGKGVRTIGELDLGLLRDWMAEFNQYGNVTSVLTDGHDLAVYADKDAKGPVYLWAVVPPYEQVAFGDEDLMVDLTRRGAAGQRGVVVSSSPLEARGSLPVEWTMLPPGTLVVIRQGAVRALINPDSQAQAPTSPAFHVRARQKLPERAEPKVLDVIHRTVYRYEKAVERSTHLLKLTPAHDHVQRLISHGIELSVEGRSRDFDDVFGSRARRVLIDRPYTELSIVARSRVETLDVDPLSFRPIHASTQIPLVWMPWQRHMLQPYLLPPELPETELRELTDYAMGFVKRNDYDLLDTLLDINATLFGEYRYQQGVTDVFTSAYDVYVNRRGVCQDFTNLFICLSRLLGVPSRYVCGYLYTGPKHPNQRMAEASHAWVQVYLPEVGWRGFDPTNGVLTQTDHVRVAIGRNYVDATPTSGTLYVGGGDERLEVEVRVERLV